MVCLHGREQKRNGERVKMLCSMWVDGNETSEHSGSCDLNPKKEIERVEEIGCLFDWQ